MKPQLYILANVNRQMQKETQSIYITYGKIDSLSFVQPIPQGITGQISEENLKDVEESIVNIPGEDLHEHLKETLMILKLPRKICFCTLIPLDSL